MKTFLVEKTWSFNGQGGYKTDKVNAESECDAYVASMEGVGGDSLGPYESVISIEETKFDPDITFPKTIVFK